MGRAPASATGNRREDLLRVAARLFSRRGFHGTSMGAIAEETGIHKASLYHWIESKEDLLYQVLSGALDALIDQAQSIAGEVSLSYADRLRGLVALHANYAVSHADTMQVFYAESKWLSGPRGRQIRDVRRQYFRIYEDLFREARERGEFQVKELDIPVYVNCLFSMASFMSNWYRHEGPYSPGDVGNLMSELVLGAVLPD